LPNYKVGLDVGLFYLFIAKNNTNPWWKEEMTPKTHKQMMFEKIHQTDAKQVGFGN
jgi:hypothetical protein